MTDSELTPEERAEIRAITRTRGEAAKGAGNPEVRVEYHRRLARGETLLMAWRRALWVVYQRNNA